MGISIELIFIALAVLGGLGLIFAIIYLINFWQRKKLDPLAAELGGQVSVSLLGGAQVRLQNDRFEACIKVTAGSQYSPPYLIIEQLSPLFFKLTISRENIATRALGRWGVLKEVKVGDPLFDGKYYIRSDNEAGVSNFIHNPDRRVAIEYFFNEDFTVIKGDTRATAVWKASYRDEDLAPEKIRDHLEQLRKLAVL